MCIRKPPGPRKLLSPSTRIILSGRRSCAARIVLEYLRQCIYDALAEWQAGNKISRFDADTIKWLKDGFLRLPTEIERHQADRDAAANDASPHRRSTQQAGREPP